MLLPNATKWRFPGVARCPPLDMSHERTALPFMMVCVCSRSFDVDLVCLFGCLATAVDEAAPSHDLRRTVHHGVYLLTAQIQETTCLPVGEQRCTQGHKPTCQRIQAGEITNSQPCRSPAQYNTSYYVWILHISTEGDKGTCIAGTTRGKPRQRL